ncbi:MAG: hypothetical protein ACK42F_01350 [Sphingobacteriales bacterium]
MKTQCTIYHLIVDRSGSMNDCLDATINGYNEQLQKIRELQMEFPEQDIRMGLTIFNDQIYIPAVAADLSKATNLSRENYVPNGSTSLFDAIGSTTLKLEETIGKNTNLPTTFVIVVLTDGYENSSQMFNLHQIRSHILRLEATGNWTFSFIGATLDAAEVAQQMAFKVQNSYSFHKNAMKSEVWDRLSGSMRNYMDKKRTGKNLSNFFDE